MWAGDGWIILDSQKINNTEFGSALSPKDLPAIEAMNMGENSGYIKWTNGLLVQAGIINTTQQGNFWNAFPIEFYKLLYVNRNTNSSYESTWAPFYLGYGASERGFYYRNYGIICKGFYFAIGF